MELLLVFLLWSRAEKGLTGSAFVYGEFLFQWLP